MSALTIWACRACGRMGDSPTDLLRQGCEGTHELFVPAALQQRLHDAMDDLTLTQQDLAGERAEVAALRADLAEAKAEHAAVQEKYAKELARYYHKNRALRADRDAQAEALRVARRFVAETETEAERERRNEPLSLWRGGVLKEIDRALAVPSVDATAAPCEFGCGWDNDPKYVKPGFTIVAGCPVHSDREGVAELPPVSALAGATPHDAVDATAGAKPLVSCGVLSAHPYHEIPCATSDPPAVAASGQTGETT